MLQPETTPASRYVTPLSRSRDQGVPGSNPIRQGHPGSSVAARPSGVLLVLLLQPKVANYYICRVISNES